MSKEVDQRVVQMRFDNQQFESGVKTTLGTLDKLKSGLNLENSAKSLENLNSSVKKLDFNPLAAGVETVKNKFSALEVMAVTALANITNSAVNAGKQLINSLTVEPKKQGFNEYELKMGSVQTIMASTGASLSEVNAYLGELNTYADKTIYSFSDMTSSIGKFTNSGVDLKSAVKAIQGISNEAAVSGANAEQASHAMYNFAQALSSGSVKLIDWKSIENANMATVEFKQQLIDTAVSLGTVVKQGDKYVTTTTNAKGEVSDAFDAVSMFNDSLSHQWMTTDVLVETLGKYADETTDIGKKAFAAAQDVKTFSQLMDTVKEAIGSGWAETWEILFGDFNEAKKLWTELSDAIGSVVDNSSKNRNTLLKNGLSSGWKQLMNEGIHDTKGFENEVIKVAKANGVAVDDILKKYDTFEESLKEGWVSSDILKKSVNQMLDGIHGLSKAQKEEAGYTDEQIRKFEDFVSKVNKGSISVEEFADKIAKPSGRENIIQSVRNALEGFMSVIKPVKEAFREIFPPSTGDALYKITENIKNFTEKMKLNAEQQRLLKDAFKGLFSIIKLAGNVIKSVISVVSGLFKIFSGSSDTVLKAAAAIGNWCTNLQKATEESNLFTVAANNVIVFFKKAAEKIGGFFAAVKEKADESGITGFFKTIFHFAVETGKVVFEACKKVGGSLIDAIKDLSLPEALDIINTGFFGALVIDITKFVNGVDGAFGGFDKILKGVNNVLGGVKGCLEAWQKSINADIIMKIAKAVAILAASLFVMALIDPDKLTMALVGLYVIMNQLAGALERIGSVATGFSNVGKAVVMMGSFSIAILLLASALKKIASLSLEKMAAGIVGIYMLMEELIHFLNKANFSGVSVSAGVGIIALAIALKVMASAVSKFAKIDTVGLVKGLVAVVVIMEFLGRFVKQTSSGMTKGFFSVGAAIILISSSMKILASAVSSFGKLQISELLKGVAAVGALLTVLSLFFRQMDKLSSATKKVVSIGVSVVAMSISLNILASAVKKMGRLDLPTLAKGVLGIGFALGEIVAAMRLMPKNIIGISVGLAVLGAALNEIALAVMLMGTMSVSSVVKGLIVLGGAMLILAKGLKAMCGSLKGVAVLSLASAALATLVPSLVVLSVIPISKMCAALLGLVGVFGTLGLVAKILKPVASTLMKLSKSLILLGIGCTLISAGLLVFSIALSSLLGSLAIAGASIGPIIQNLCDSIASGAGSIVNMVASLVEAGCDGLKRMMPVIADTAFTVIIDSLISLKTYLPKIVDLVMDILVQLMDKLRLRLPELVASAARMIGDFMSELDKAFGEREFKNLLTSLKSVSIIFVAFAKTAEIISKLSVRGVIKGLPAFAIAVAGIGTLLAALGGLSKLAPKVGDAISNGAAIMGAIGKAIGAFVGGIVDGIISNLPKDITQVITGMGSIYLIVKAMSPVVKILSSMNADFKAVLKGMGSIGIVFAGITVLLAAFGGLSKIPGFNELISSGGKTFVDIGRIIGEFIGTFMSSLAESLKADIGQVLVSLLAVVGLVSAIAIVTKVVGKFKTSPAVVAEGFAGIGVAVGCITALLAALGGLAQIPGFDWIIGEGGKILCQIGDILGNFVGSLVGGIGKGVTAAMPEMGENLSNFMTAVTPFVEGTKKIDGKVFDGITHLAGAILMLTAASLINSLLNFTSLLTGKSSMDKFCEDFVKLGTGVAGFADETKGIDPSTVEAAANAAKALGQAASKIPNSGGLIAKLVGDNDDVEKFGTDLVAFGEGIAGFSEKTKDIKPKAVTAAAEAAKSLAQAASDIPNSGGFVAKIVGDNDPVEFGSDLIALGKGISGFSVATKNVKPNTVKAAAEAAKSLAQAASDIPNSGGFVAKIVGDNDPGKFGKDLIELGKGITGFSDAVQAITPANVTAAAEAAKILGQAAAEIPDTGGLISKIVGDNDIGTFGEDLTAFGKGLAGFSDETKSVDPAVLTPVAEAIKILTQAAADLPETGGLASLFAGDNNIADFGDDLVKFGTSLNAFSTNTPDVDPAAISTAANATKDLVEIANGVPNSGGMKSWFAGDNNIADFGDDLVKFGAGLASLSENSSGIDTEVVDLAVSAGERIISFAESVPNTGGMKSWFAGDNSLGTLGKDIGKFGEGLSELSKNASGISVEHVNAAVEAGKSLAEMTKTVPNTGGIKSWFVGDNSLKHFGKDIAAFGKQMTKFSENTDGLDVENVETATSAGKSIAEMTQTIPNPDGGTKFKKIGKDIAGFGKQIKAFSDNVDGLDVENVTAGTTAAGKLVEVIKIIPNDYDPKTTENILGGLANGLLFFSGVVGNINMEQSVTQVEKVTKLAKNVKNADMSGLETLTVSLKNVADNGITRFINAFTNADLRAKGAIKDFVDKIVKHVKELRGDFGTVGNDYITSFVNVVKNSTRKVSKGFTDVIGSGVSAIKEKLTDLQNVGSELMSKLLNGAKSKANSMDDPFETMLSGSINAVKAKYSGFYDAGKYLSEGFAKGISENLEAAENAAGGMAQAALDAAQKTLDIHSPSKKAYSLGDYTGMAFVAALDDYRDRSYTAGAEMAISAKDGLADAISRISDIIDGNVECAPTIRPVLDLSNVKNGVSEMGGMLSANRSIDLAARTSFGADMSVERRQNGSNKDVVDAVSALREDVASLKGVVGNLKVVMDGGALVGQIADKMDNALGKKARLANRR